MEVTPKTKPSKFCAHSMGYFCYKLTDGKVTYAEEHSTQSNLCRFEIVIWCKMQTNIQRFVFGRYIGTVYNYLQPT